MADFGISAGAAAGAAGTTSTTATVATVASIALMAMSAVRSGQMQAAAANQAKELAERNATGVGMQTAQEIARIRRMAVLRKGSMRAGFAASGVTMEGTPLDLLEESATQAEMDVNTIKQLGYMKAKGANIDASMEAARAQNATQGGYLKAAGTLLSGYGSVAGTTTTTTAPSAGTELPFGGT